MHCVWTVYHLGELYKCISYRLFMFSSSERSGFIKLLHKMFLYEQPPHAQAPPCRPAGLILEPHIQLYTPPPIPDRVELLQHCVANNKH